ncbi:MAG: hypothetical protein K9L28_04300 [Synergistales bacterium]|nr:hypothetical protein [Synergistales bacterium]
MKGFLIAAVFVLMAFAAVNTGSAALASGHTDPMDYDGTIMVGSQTVNETTVLAWMAKHLIEEYSGLNVKINTNFAASAVVFQAMRGGEVDIFPSWTGTMLRGILRYEGENLPPEESYQKVKEGFEEHFNVTWAKPLGFSNTYVMAVREETAEEYDLEKASDLAPYAPKWKLGGDENFDTLPDAYPGWSEAYGIEFKKVLPMQYAMMYKAIENKDVEVIAAYATDSRIKKLNLEVLEDDKEYFPDYSACYVIDMETLDEYPAVLDIVEKLSGEIDAKTMAALNLRYDNGEEPEDIAGDFLVEHGYIGK